jgi:hypothetical protein
MKLLNLNKHHTVGDEISVNYTGPGFYSALSNKPLGDPLILVKVGEEYMDEHEMYQFCKLNGYRIKPYLIGCCNDIPSYWDINTGCLDEDEY